MSRLLILLLGLLSGALLGGGGLARRRIDELRRRLGEAERSLEAALRDLEAAGAAPAAAEEIARCREELDRWRRRHRELEAQWRRAEPFRQDDLTKIEGIGPKIEGLLNDAGIRTFARLAEAPAAELRKILGRAGPRYRFHDPGTWPRQAGLAAAGAWEELAELQDRLKGGREV